VRRLERTVGRMTGAVVFAALLIAGATLYGADPGLGRLLMGGSAVPLLWVMVAGRGRHPGRRG